jgi:hypothetical protein
MDNPRAYLGECPFFLHRVVIDLELIKFFWEGLQDRYDEKVNPLPGSYVVVA